MNISSTCQPLILVYHKQAQIQYIKITTKNKPKRNKTPIVNSPPINAYDDNIDSNAPIVSVNASINQNNKSTNNSTPNKTTNNQNTNSAKCWQIDYYRPYFDVDTSSLLTRLKRSMIPTSQFLDSEMNEKADLLCLY